MSKFSTRKVRNTDKRDSSKENKARDIGKRKARNEKNQRIESELDRE